MSMKYPQEVAAEDAAAVFFIATVVCDQTCAGDVGEVDRH